MPRRPCITCGQLTTGSYCAIHARRTWAGGSTRAWRGLRAQALLKDGHQCVTCGATPGLEVHHRTPRHHGGRDVLENLETRCADCHHAAHEAASRRSPALRPRDQGRERLGGL